MNKVNISGLQQAGITGKGKTFEQNACRAMVNTEYEYNSVNTLPVLNWRRAVLHAGENGPKGRKYDRSCVQAIALLNRRHKGKGVGDYTALPSGTSFIYCHTIGCGCL
jgi:hypothetical protein